MIENKALSGLSPLAPPSDIFWHQFLSLLTLCVIVKCNGTLKTKDLEFGIWDASIVLSDGGPRENGTARETEGWHNAASGTKPLTETDQGFREKRLRRGESLDSDNGYSSIAGMCGLAVVPSYSLAPIVKTLRKQRASVKASR